MATSSEPAVPAHHLDDDEPLPSLRERLAAFARPPARIFGALLVPDRTLPTVVAEERYGGALLVVTVMALLAAGVIGLRYDVTADVLARNAGAAPTAAASGSNRNQSGTAAPVEDAPKSDREIEDEITKARAVGKVKLGLAAGLGTPFGVVTLALGLYLIGRFVGGKPTMKRALAAAAHASLPGAVKAGLAAVIAFQLPAVRPDEVDGLAVFPDGGGAALADPVAARLFAGVDLFTVWTVLLCAFGLAAAARMGRTRAFIAVLVSFTLWLAVTRLAGGGGGQS